MAPVLVHVPGRRIARTKNLGRLGRIGRLCVDGRIGIVDYADGWAGREAVDVGLRVGAVVKRNSRRGQILRFAGAGVQRRA